MVRATVGEGRKSGQKNVRLITRNANRRRAAEAAAERDGAARTNGAGGHDSRRPDKDASAVGQLLFRGGNLSLVS